MRNEISWRSNVAPTHFPAHCLTVARYRSFISANSIGSEYFLARDFNRAPRESRHSAPTLSGPRPAVTSGSRMIMILSFVLVIALRCAPWLAPRCPLEISDGRSRPTSWERRRGHRRDGYERHLLYYSDSCFEFGGKGDALSQRIIRRMQGIYFCFLVEVSSESRVGKQG